MLKRLPNIRTPNDLWKTDINFNYQNLKLGKYLPPNLLPNFKFSTPGSMVDFGRDLTLELPKPINENKSDKGLIRKEIWNYEKHVLAVDRVVRVTKGGKQSSFRVLAVIGNQNGLVGLGIGKAKQPRDAIPKALADAYHNLVSVPLFQNRTLYHDATTRFKATLLELRTVPVGYGLRCNHVLHAICQCAGILDIGSKVHGSTNVMNVSKAMMQALKFQRSIQDISIQRGVNIVDLKSKFYGE
eukprot:NODE_230_length_12188_cov_0.969890.p6 type:complete len:242 gc:universal NODE_230_length_12188_cov_0.969890:11024-10299(-)